MGHVVGIPTDQASPDKEGGGARQVYNCRELGDGSCGLIPTIATPSFLIWQLPLENDVSG